jgi:hypothetical protein
MQHVGSFYILTYDAWRIKHKIKYPKKCYVINIVHFLISIILTNKCTQYIKIQKIQFMISMNSYMYGTRAPSSESPPEQRPQPQNANPSIDRLD